MEKKKLVGCIGVVVSALLLSIVSIILNAWALKVLWGWFFVPFGLPNFTIVEAAGISLVVNFLIRGAINTNDDVDWYKAFASAFLSPVFSVGMGWILLQFA